MGKRDTKFYKASKKQIKEAVVIDEATMDLVSVRIGVIAACLEAVAAELDDLNDYHNCIIPIDKSKNGREMQFHSIIPLSLSNTIKNTMQQMDKVVAPLLGKNDKTMFQALKVSDLFTGAIEEVQNRYLEAQGKEREETRKVIKDKKVCMSCGNFHHGKPTEKVTPEKGDCFVCGDENLDVYPSRVFNYCGYKVD